MDTLDIESLLKKNPHVDEAAVKRRQKKAAQQAKKRRPRQGPASPFGRRHREGVSGEGWGATVEPAYRPHYRGI
jgi:hypothetical protein